jgi:hypothetical protein
MLTIELYQLLSEQAKAEVIMQGTFLADREENELVVQLYNVGSFYGEVYYDRLANRILRYVYLKVRSS